LMVVDAAFTSIGLNYFTPVIPKVEEFNKRFVETGRIKNLKELAEADINELREVWNQVDDCGGGYGLCRGQVTL